ncbi:amylo-alpha-1,6-glucosidase [Leptolyngbya sp. 'hensonii']|uniref:amylo-alpha-1,6-glucosidase n=1 Tax=Leptolyngbya sp. 'hensonii' TaxID=1922337 RepID=UPI00094FFB9A|nr:amylo-alpha-1,6-glucosidase [Leptolyngbya sp. 'hensonii']OLP20015.1 amylo-alpha-1,6-glucosidase [Leptolyngbya sp. 'hensonii']
MAELDAREWLLTNGLGSFACGTVCDARTRTYHGWLIAALDPPDRRTLLLSHLEASLELGGEVFALGTNFWVDDSVSPRGYRFLQSFEISPVPTWVWSQGDWNLTRQILMPYGLEALQTDAPDAWALTTLPASSLGFTNRVLIQYRYCGRCAALLRLRILMGDRSFHQQQKVEPDLHFSQVVSDRQMILQAIAPDRIGTPWHLTWTLGEYQPDGLWYWNYYYPEENRRGLGDYEDLYSPGYLTLTLEPEMTLTLEARVGLPHHSSSPLNDQTFQQALQTEEQRLRACYRALPKAKQTELWPLLRAGDQFMAYRASTNSPTMMAGYPWFSDWGRNTLIALPGLTLATHRFALAKGLLQTFSRYGDQGLIPNSLPSHQTLPFYNGLDTVLWWIEALGLYLEATQDWAFLVQQYPIVQRIYKSLTAGTRYNIRVDAADGLLTWNDPDVALTWMDTIVEQQPITPRRGKPIEINALWYSALCWVGQWADHLSQTATETEINPTALANQSRRYAQHAQQVRRSLGKFWNPDRGYFYDTIAPDDNPDPTIRPNAVIALSLHHCGFPVEQARLVLQVARDRLLTDYGLRSLDPSNPAYVGTYAGDLYQRDRAYHQGTVWSWLLGPFGRAWNRFYGQPLPFDWQPLFDHLNQQGCLGSISEIFDGDFPHTPQGAIAQAWSVAEIMRCLLELQEEAGHPP